MWLLDVNLPTALTRLLRGYGILAETAAGRGSRELTNGALASRKATTCSRFTVGNPATKSSIVSPPSSR